MRQLYWKSRQTLDFRCLQTSVETTNVIYSSSYTINVRRPIHAQVSGRTKDLEPFTCVSPGRDVLIDVSS